MALAWEPITAQEPEIHFISSHARLQQCSRDAAHYRVKQRTWRLPQIHKVPKSGAGAILASLTKHLTRNTMVWSSSPNLQNALSFRLRGTARCPKLSSVIEYRANNAPARMSNCLL
jgi:hypothetical protein